MISRETITEAATRYHTRDFNIAREYVQHMFLNYLYKKADSERLLFKGGTALRIVYKSPRFSEDLDYSSFGLTAAQIENLFLNTLADLERFGLSIALHEKSHETSGGYYGEAKFNIYEHAVALEINVNAKAGDIVTGEYKLIHGDFAPNYGLQMLPESILVQEKVQALMTRKKPRDFYDLYFMLRAGLISPERREVLRQALPIIETTDIDFRQELEVFLPQDHQAIIRDFKQNLLSEIKRNLGV
jgi:predicted nucleotidyltransferase component of viral defense system